MDPHVVVRKVAATASDFIDLRLSSCLDFDACADRVSIGVRTFQAQCNPVIPVPTLIMEKTGAIIQIHHKHIDVPIVIEISERSTSRRLGSH